jgi:peptidoglycan hydrolase CwlO-like protein
MSDIKDISVSDRLNLRNTWATLEDMKNYCENMACMIEDFIYEIAKLQDENKELKENLEDANSEIEDLKESIKELEYELE